MTGVSDAGDAPQGADRQALAPTASAPAAGLWQRVRPMQAFAQLAASLEADLEPSRFERVGDAEIVGVVAARITTVPQAGSPRAAGQACAPSERPGFTVEAKAELRLTCQSCGESFAHVVRASSTLWVARDERELLAWEQAAARRDAQADHAEGEPVAHGAAELEIVLADEEASALSLIEDELLLALPVVPRCPPCAASPEAQRFSFG